MSDPRPLPPGPLIAYYGDDFTGSSAVMEVTAFAGLDSVLFLAPPTPARLRAFAGCRVIGIAGTARAQTPAWMEAELPAIFAGLAGTGAPVLLYKVCSTFDSAPAIGSIGTAIDLAAERFAGWHPLLVADPGMGRYQAFGHLFAQAQGAVHRLDRHPVMARHPVTPMDEADLARHLARQTARRIGLVDLAAMKAGAAQARLAHELEAGAEIVSLDVIDRETLVAAGRLIWQHGPQPIFGIGSQGLAAALVACWREAGLLPQASPPRRPAPVSRLICVSGSVSPITAGQIACAEAAGFAVIRLDAARAVEPRGWKEALDDATQAALAALSNGRDVVVATATGPDDPAVAGLRAAVAATSSDEVAVNARIGTGLGTILDRVLTRTGLRRAVISGGDSSGRAAAVLGIDALRAMAPLAPGSPLCIASSPRPERDGLELALKGGQVGAPDFFMAAKG